MGCSDAVPAASASAPGVGALRSSPPHDVHVGLQRCGPGRRMKSMWGCSVAVPLRRVKSLGGLQRCGPHRLEMCEDRGGNRALHAITPAVTQAALVGLSPHAITWAAAGGKPRPIPRQRSHAEHGARHHMALLLPAPVKPEAAEESQLIVGIRQRRKPQGVSASPDQAQRSDATRSVRQPWARGSQRRKPLRRPNTARGAPHHFAAQRKRQAV